MAKNNEDRVCERCVHEKVCKYKDTFIDCRDTVFVGVGEWEGKTLPDGLLYLDISCREFKPKDAVMFRQTVVEKKDLM